MISLKSARPQFSVLQNGAEIEGTRWTQFRSYLEKYRKEFDQMYDYFKLHSAARRRISGKIVEM